MSPLPYHVEGEGSQPAYHVIPDNIKGGWNVYHTHQPNEPQKHFDSKQQAVAYAEQMSSREGVGFTVEEYEAPEIGR
jgi:hypothetical protein